MIMSARDPVGARLHTNGNFPKDAWPRNCDPLKSRSPHGHFSLLTHNNPLRNTRIPKHNNLPTHVSLLENSRAPVNVTPTPQKRAL